jgi:hypothetical protein
MSWRDRQQARIVAHPVPAAIILGLAWGIPMALAWCLINGFANFGVTIAVWLSAGVVFFGPWVVVVTLRKARADTV